MARVQPDPSIWGPLTLSTVAVLSSNVSGPLSAVTVGGDGTADGECAQDEDAFGCLGVVFRPRLASKAKGNDGREYDVGAEAIAARMGDRLTPFSWRDLRLNSVFPAPKHGTVALVGYGGGFLAFDDTEARDSLATLYVPYANGTKAHAVILDPENESVKIVNANGTALLVDKDRVIVKNASGNAYLEVGADGVVCNGNLKVVGGLDCGGGLAMPLVNATAFNVALTAAAVPFAVEPPIPMTTAMMKTFCLALTGALTGPAATTLTKGL